MSWEAVEAALPRAKAIAFDGCHKIYVLLDHEQVTEMFCLGYRGNRIEGNRSLLYTVDEKPAEEMLTTLHEWYDLSCSLRFISSVTTNRENPNAGYTNLISQFEDDKEEDPE